MINLVFVQDVMESRRKVVDCDAEEMKLLQMPYKDVGMCEDKPILVLDKFENKKIHDQVFLQDVQEWTCTSCYHYFHYKFNDMLKILKEFGQREICHPIIGSSLVDQEN